MPILDRLIVPKHSASRRLCMLGVACAFLGIGLPANAQVPADRLIVLSRGINLTNWFRFPARQDPKALRTYIGDVALADLRRAGFTYARLAVQPEVIQAQDGRLKPDMLAALLDVIGRIQRAGLGVMVEPHPQNWNLENSQPDRQRLIAFWRELAPRLRDSGARLTYPEIVNEPVFSDKAAWERLQGQVLSVIRSALPKHTVALTGSNWSTLDSLIELKPVPDRNVVYTFHSYEPQILAVLAAWEPGLDRDALARLPFPADDRNACEATVSATPHSRTRDIGNYYCSMRWNAATLRELAQRAAAWGRANNAVVLATEMGASFRINAPARLAYLKAMREAYEQAGIRWAL